MSGCVVCGSPLTAGYGPGPGMYVLSRAKKFHVGDSGSEGEGEEVRKFQELYPSMDEECVFKKPTAKVWCG